MGRYRVRSSFKYEGARLLRHLKVIKSILKIIHTATDTTTTTTTITSTASSTTSSDLQMAVQGRLQVRTLSFKHAHKNFALQT